MKVVFDLDYTLLDTAKFKEAMAEAVTSCGVPRDRYEEAYKAVVKREGKVYDYDPEAHLEALRPWFPDEVALTEARRRLDEVVAGADKYLFPGSVELLKELRQEGRETVLMTLGNEAWQKRKVDNSGLGALFDEVILTGKHKVGLMKGLAKPGEKVVIVNDNGEEMREMMREAPSYVYIMKKGPKPKPADLKLPEADDLAELEELLMKEGALSREAGRELKAEIDGAEKASSEEAAEQGRPSEVVRK